MATTDTIICANTAPDIISQANAYLATLVNPQVLNFRLLADDLAKRPGVEFSLFLTVATGGPALATPFLLDILAGSQPQLTAALATYRTTYAAQFLSPARLLRIDNDSILTPRLMAAFLRNTTAGATANYSAGT